MRIPFDSLCVKAVCDECQLLLGHSVRRVFQSSPTTLVLDIESEHRMKIVISWHAEFARMHLVNRRLLNLEDLPGFVQTIKHHLTGSRLENVEQVGFDRIVNFRFINEGKQFVLRAEFIGKHAQILLLNGAGHTLASSRRAAQLSEPDSRPSVLSASRIEELSACSGVSPFLRKLVEASGFGIFAECNPVLSPGNGAYPVSISALGLDEMPFESYSEAADRHFSEVESTYQRKQERDSLGATLKRSLDARKRRESETLSGIAAGERASHEQMLGELILAYGFQSTGSVVSAVDYAGEPLI
ncbi:MAG TPA: NFACT family protein, partial [Fimbriimonadaceae bacterium]|nr:NFACT family protein [Fimbriimonadaceae bacterium]